MPSSPPLAPDFDAIVCLLTDPIDEEVLRRVPRAAEGGRQRRRRLQQHRRSGSAQSGYRCVQHTGGPRRDHRGSRIPARAGRITTCSSCRETIYAQDAGTVGESTSTWVAKYTALCSDSSDSVVSLRPWRDGRRDSGCRAPPFTQADGVGWKHLRSRRVDGALGHREPPRPTH